MKTTKKCRSFKKYLGVVRLVRIQVQNVPPPCSNPFCRHADKMQDEGFQPARLFQRPYLFTDTADEIEVEVLQHGGNHHEHHVLSHEGKRQVRPSEVVVLYVEVLFARLTFVVERDDVFLGRRPVVGEDAAACVYHPENAPPYPAVPVLHGTSLYDEPVRLPSDEVVFDLIFLT